MEVDGEPIRISVCHCLACQKRTGSAFGVQARFADADVRIAGNAKTYTRTGDSGGTITHSFCAECGATVYYQLSGAPGAIAIPVGGFADPSFPPPRVSVSPDRWRRSTWCRRHSRKSLPSVTVTCDGYRSSLGLSVRHPVRSAESWKGSKPKRCNGSATSGLSSDDDPRKHVGFSVLCSKDR